MRRIPLALAAAAVLAVAGCGGDDGGSGGNEEAEALTKAEFIEQGNAICAEGNEEIETAAQEVGQNSPPEEIEAFAADTVVPSIQEQIDGLSDLAPPEGDEDTVEEIIQAAQDANDQLEEDPWLVTSDEDPFNEANDLASDYGLEECAG